MNTTSFFIILALVCLFGILVDAVIATEDLSSEREFTSIATITPWNDHYEEQNVRALQLSDNGKCWSTRDDRKPNRYCLFDDTPREGAFLSLSCPTSKDGNMQNCQCTIGIGDSQDAPNTDTCWKCGFCRDGSLAYDCRNVAEGTCIGRNCLDECLSSYKEPEDLLLGSHAHTTKAGLLLVISSAIVVASAIGL